MVKVALGTEGSATAAAVGCVAADFAAGTFADVDADELELVV